MSYARLVTIILVWNNNLSVNNDGSAKKQNIHTEKEKKLHRQNPTSVCGCKVDVYKNLNMGFKRKLGKGE